MQSRELRPKGSRGLVIEGKGFHQLYNLSVVKEAWSKSSPMDFIEVLPQFQMAEATDLHGKVYSLLSLADKKYQDALLVGYSPSNTTVDVYHQLAQYAVTTQDVTSPLQAAGCSQKADDLPWWVPD